MSKQAKGKVGIPVALLHEARGETVTVELQTGQLYTGRLVASEDSMNCTLANVSHLRKNGSVAHLEHVFIRGSHIRLVGLPDSLKHSELFKIVNKVKQQKIREAKKKEKAKLKALKAALQKGKAPKRSAPPTSQPPRGRVPPKPRR